MNKEVTSDDFTNEQLERIDDVLSEVFNVCEVFAKDKQSLDAQCSIEYCGPIAEYATMCMLNVGLNVHYPFFEDDGETSFIADYYTPENTSTKGWNLDVTRTKKAMTADEKEKVDKANAAVLNLCKFLTEKEDLKTDDMQYIVDSIAEAVVDYMDEAGIEADYPAFE